MIGFDLVGGSFPFCDAIAIVSCLCSVEVDSSQLQRNALPPNFPLATLFFWHAPPTAQHHQVSHVTYVLSVILPTYKYIQIQTQIQVRKMHPLTQMSHVTYVPSIICKHNNYSHSLQTLCHMPCEHFYKRQSAAFVSLKCHIGQFLVKGIVRILCACALCAKLDSSIVRS